MAREAFLANVVELAACESLQELLDRAALLHGAELGVRSHIEVWDTNATAFATGQRFDVSAAHCTWIGIEYTIGAIYIDAAAVDAAVVDLLARQLAPLAERLMEREASQRRTIREDIERLYDRRIRDALMRLDWNASAVARELFVSRSRVADVARRWRSRSLIALQRNS
jgi:transcriptional regulator with GAF, ATPase, and Fis domain